MYKYLDSQQTITEESFRVKKLDNLLIGGQPTIKLHAPFTEDQKHPAIVGAAILPGRGMNIFQLQAFLPGHGLFNMLASIPLAEAADYFSDSDDDSLGNRSFMVGGAILLPFAGRIRGNGFSQGGVITVSILNKAVTIPANWSSGGNSHREKVAHHGLILKRGMHSIHTGSDTSQAFVEARFNAEDYGCGWPGNALHTITGTLTESGFDLSVNTKNTGREQLPVSTGWHPYFTLPSQNREKMELSLNANSRLEVNNYDDVFPTGGIIPIRNTKHDFVSNGGKTLGSMYLDDCYVDLQKNGIHETVTTLYDPSSNYGLNVSANHVVNAVQIYAPTDKSFVAIEPQMNLPDPFNRSVWGERDTGMKILKENEETTYSVRVSLFQK